MRTEIWLDGHKRQYYNIVASCIFSLTLEFINDIYSICLCWFVCLDSKDPVLRFSKKIFT